MAWSLLGSDGTHRRPAGRAHRAWAPRRRVDPSAMAEGRTWTLGELRSELERFEDELRAAGLLPTTVHTYVDRAGVFLRWLDGDYHPRGPVRR
jgi:hypothetical protein